MEATILVFDMFIAILFCLAVFMLSSHFLKKPEYFLLATLFAILGARFIDTTYWDGSSRGPIVVMITLASFVLFRVAATRQRPLYLVAFMFCLGCFMVHHMAVLLASFGLAYVLAAFQVNYLLPRMRSHQKLKIGAFNLLLLMSVVFISYSMFSFFRDLSLVNISDESLFSFEPELIAIMLNLAASYTNQIGFILPVAIFGLPSLFLRDRLSLRSLFPVCLLIAFIPLLGSSLYVSMILAPFVSILGVFWIARAFRTSARKRLVQAFVIVLLVSSLVLPVISIQRWNEEIHMAGDAVEVNNQLFSDSCYLTWFGDEWHAISNSEAETLQLSAVSEIDFLGSDLFLPISDDVTPVDVAGNTIWSTARFPVNLYKWFEYENEPRVNGYIKGLMVSGLDYLYGPAGSYEAAEYFATHTHLMVVVDMTQPTSFVDSFSMRPAMLTSQLFQASWPIPSETSEDCVSLNSYCFYQSEGVTLFLLELPE